MWDKVCLGIQLLGCVGQEEREQLVVKILSEQLAELVMRLVDGYERAGRTWLATSVCFLCWHERGLRGRPFCQRRPIAKFVPSLP